VNLCYETHPNLTKEDTFFLHGNLASTRWWQPMLQEWQRQGSDGQGSLIFADWRGCGKNPDWSPDKAFTLKDLAQDNLELLDQLGSRKTALVGHSLGGLIALQMMILEPHRFTRAVVVDPVGAQGVVFDDSMYEAFRQMAANADLTRTVILSTILGQENLDDRFKVEISLDAHKAVRGIGTSVLEILKSVDLREDLKTVEVPTLILHGAQDAVIPLVDSEALVKTLPNSRLEILKDQGHCFNVENPQAFTARVREFLRGEKI
jgi:3-oxoadipate enol-lactonase